jgi:phage portal protein BeeE
VAGRRDPAGDAQFIETRKFQVREAARTFRVPPYKIADLEAGSVSYASWRSSNSTT